MPLNADEKEVIEYLTGRWIVEVAELKGLKKTDIEHLKALLSRRRDRARPAYGRLVEEVPRQCVFFGTTNSAQYLRDPTGNRRFWPVRVKRFDLAALRDVRDQLWAEAAQAEKNGENIRLDARLWAAACDEQEARRVEDPWVGTISEALGDLNGLLAVEDAWLIVNVPEGSRTQEHNARLGEAMRELGWERTRRRRDGSRQYAYARGSEQEREQWIDVMRDPLTRLLVIDVIETEMQKNIDETAKAMAIHEQKRALTILKRLLEREGSDEPRIGCAVSRDRWREACKEAKLAGPGGSSGIVFQRAEKALTADNGLVERSGPLVFLKRHLFDQTEAESAFFAAAE